MQAATAIGARAGTRDQHEQLLFRFEARLNVLPIGIVPEGLRMANTYDGVVVDGALPGGSRVWGNDHLLLRSDGVCVINAQTTISQPNGVHIYEEVHGYCLPPERMHVPLEMLLEPGFEWPDIDFPIVGFAMFRAAAPEYVDLNGATARIDGWVNFKTGGLAVTTRLVSHDATVARPAR